MVAHLKVRQKADNIRQKIWHADYTDDLVLFAYTTEQAARNIGLYMISDKMSVFNKKEPSPL